MSRVLKRVSWGTRRSWRCFIWFHGPSRGINGTQGMLRELWGLWKTQRRFGGPQWVSGGLKGFLEVSGVLKWITLIARIWGLGDVSGGLRSVSVASVSTVWGCLRGVS